jgi:RNA polymerase sigma-70 factor (ECF subfamily)
MTSHRGTDETGGPAFDDLYELQYARLVAALHLADPRGGRGAAEEVAQEAFVRLLVRWRSVDDPAAYLYRTAFRHQRRRRIRASRGRDLEQQAAPPAATTTMEDAVVARQAVESVLDRLTRRQRECAVLSLYLGFTTEEVADLLHIRASTVRVHLHAARTYLSALTSQELAAGKH